MNSSLITLPVALFAAILTALFLFSLQPSTFAALPLLAADCALASAGDCTNQRGHRGETSSETSPDKADESKRFAGTFTNTTVNISGPITIDLTINSDDTIEGNIDFSAYSNGNFYCGSGDFEGTKSGDQIEINFVSDDVSPACGFYQGVSFVIEAALLNNTIIRGDYATDTGHKGIVELRELLPAIGLYLPFARH